MLPKLILWTMVNCLSYNYIEDNFNMVITLLHSLMPKVTNKIYGDKSNVALLKKKI